MQGVTYRLSFNDSPYWAIGSTVKSLGDRKWSYCKDATTGRLQTQLYGLINEVGPEGFELTEIEVYYFKDIADLRKAEQALIVEHRDDLETPYCLNCRNAYLTEEDSKAADRAYMQEYREANRDRLLQQQRQYNQSHATEKLEKSREYNSTHRQQRLDSKRKHNEGHREEQITYSRTYYQNNIEERREKARDYQRQRRTYAIKKRTSEQSREEHQ